MAKNPTKFLGSELSALYNQMLAQLAGGASLDEKNAINLAGKSRERALLDRFGSQFAGRGLSGGLGNQGQLEISRGVSNDIFGQISQSDARARSEAVRSMLGLGGINAQNRATNAQRAVGMANVGAINRRTALEEDWRAWLKNQGIMDTSGFNDGTYPGAPAPVAPAPAIPDPVDPGEATGNNVFV